MRGSGGQGDRRRRRRLPDRRPRHRAQAGDRKLLKITIPQYHEQRVGDVFGFDVVTTYHDGAKVYGGARFYVVVTPGPRGLIRRPRPAAPAGDIGQ
ncbi:hypothetical protein GCM10018954_084050 [Kutzneria kofuensis]